MPFVRSCAVVGNPCPRLVMGDKLRHASVVGWVRPGHGPGGSEGPVPGRRCVSAPEKLPTLLPKALNGPGSRFPRRPADRAGRLPSYAGRLSAGPDRLFWLFPAGGARGGLGPPGGSCRGPCPAPTARAG